MMSAGWIKKLGVKSPYEHKPGEHMSTYAGHKRNHDKHRSLFGQSEEEKTILLRSSLNQKQNPFEVRKSLNQTSGSFDTSPDGYS